MTQVTIWNEFRHERTDSDVTAVYPHGIHTTLAEGQPRTGLTVGTAILDEPEQVLPDTVFNTTDVLPWWGRLVHDKVPIALVERVHSRVLSALGLVFLN